MYGVREGSPVEVQWAVRWVEDDLWWEGFVEQMSFKSGMEERDGWCDYCNSVLAGLRASILAPLQRVLHAAARLVNGLRPHDHVSPTLKELHWLPSSNGLTTNCAS